MLESKFQAETIKMIRKMLPGCIIMKTNPNYLQGIPDTLVLFGPRWALIEFKRSENEPFQPNQEWYIEHLNAMSYSTMMCPENRKMKLDELQYALRTGGPTRDVVREPVSLVEVRRRKSEAEGSQPVRRASRNRAS